MAEGIQLTSRIVLKTMSVLRYLGLHSKAWSLRRLYCPIPRSALVLEVGSGGNPFPRSDILLDAYEETRERHWEPLCKDRPVVLGFVENLPFKDKAFDYVIACHVLEHSSDPARFLSELQRVSKAGYIEVPNAFMERIVPYVDHKLEIMERDGRLLIKKKPKRILDPWFIRSISPRINDLLSRTLIKNPFDFHTQLYWNVKIDFEIFDGDLEFNADEADNARGLEIQDSKNLRRKVLSLISKLLRTGSRGSLIGAILKCPRCDSESFERSSIRPLYTCTECSSSIKVFDNISSPANRSAEISAGLSAG